MWVLPLHGDRNRINVMAGLTRDKHNNLPEGTKNFISMEDSNIQITRGYSSWKTSMVLIWTTPHTRHKLLNSLNIFVVPRCSADYSASKIYWFLFWLLSPPLLVGFSMNDGIMRYYGVVDYDISRIYSLDGSAPNSFTKHSKETKNRLPDQRNKIQYLKFLPHGTVVPTVRISFWLWCAGIFIHLKLNTKSQ